MQIVLTASRMAQVDKTTIHTVQIPGIVLMENAGQSVVREILTLPGSIENKHVVVFCGKGNNGGDGYVIARHLHNLGAEVSVFLAGTKAAIQGDAKINLTILENMGIEIHEISAIDQIPQFHRIDLVVDALLGTGVTGPVVGFYGDLIETMNRYDAPIVSVDLPSGMETDTGAVHGVCVDADVTVTMAHLKAGLLFSPARDFAGKIVVADIGVPPEISLQLHEDIFLIDAADIRSRLPERPWNAHKTDMGKVTIFAGSVGMTGAATLASLACVRIGAGLTKLAVPASLNPILEQKLTEVMTVPLAETDQQSISVQAKDQVHDLLNWADVLAVGPGLSAHRETVEFIAWLLTSRKKPMVLDADGLNACASDTSLIEKYAGPMVLTPHPGELSRLIRIPVVDIEKNRFQIVRDLAKQWGKVIVLKGGPTLIAAPDGKVFINSSGNPGMATGGSGDVLTGIIAGLMALRLSALDAALVGVYLHGLAGDIASERLTEMGMIAGDINKYLPAALKQMFEME
ncbi:MAG: NAD(P)H-hydrate dehydratase [Candidatus Zhuqueibacterota bacterium]